MDRYIYDVGINGNCLFGHAINSDGSVGYEVGFLNTGMCDIPFGEIIDIERDDKGFTKSIKLARTGEELFDRAGYERRTEEYIESTKHLFRGA
jgi:hypothetical protein